MGQGYANRTRQYIPNTLALYLVGCTDDALRYNSCEMLQRRI
jgi:hypothetical protein